jgi:transposase
VSLDICRRNTRAATIWRSGVQVHEYTSFCIKYETWAAGLARSMRQTHIAGEKLFAD